MKESSNPNFFAFTFHALFLALTLNFIDINTVVPNMIAEAGGSSVHLGILSAIMIGGTSFMQLFFAGILMPYPKKKRFLITGIYLRVAALILLGLFLLGADGSGSEGIWKVFVILGIMTIFSFSGSFAGIAYMDILGRAIEPDRRKRFFLLKQLISSFGVIISALLVKLVLSLFAYPVNYSILFISAGVLLLIGTIGFWLIREPAGVGKTKISMSERFRAFRDAIRKDRNLRMYLLLINTSGITLVTIPFFILFGRTQFELTGTMVGTYLLVQMSGSLATNIILNMVNKNQRYKGILYMFILAGTAAPLAALILSSNQTLYVIVFLISGISLALYQIAAPGVLLEISNDENRPVYTGLAGAGSIMNMIFPIIAGLLIRLIGFPAVLVISSLIIFSGVFAAKRIDCTRISGKKTAVE
ncbi:MAG: MFS transporter [Bacteroidetes bacterium]|nr:MFS transporter [Bacteroidota bacterium]